MLAFENALQDHQASVRSVCHSIISSARNLAPLVDFALSTVPARVAEMVEV